MDSVASFLRLFWLFGFVVGCCSLEATNGIRVHKVPLYFHRPLESKSTSLFCYAVTHPISHLSSKYNFLATQVWPSARVASHWLLQYMDPSWTVTEFGCGPGLPSLTAAFLGSPKVIATDVDPLALELVQRAAHEQGWWDNGQVTTALFDLTRRDFNVQRSRQWPLPFTTDVYILSDVFESAKVAHGAAHVVHRILDHCNSARVWVFCQSDRAQRDFFLNKLQELQNDPLLAWTNGNDRNDPVKIQEERLWLCSIDETAVKYG